MLCCNIMETVEKLLYVCLLLMYICCPSYSLDNGLALRPPMGWLAWERFHCNTDCESDPENCISERLFIEMADRLISDGYSKAGYTYVNIDDCWMDFSRESDGKLESNPQRFPNGIKFLADYMHDHGLKLGIYQNLGYQTCMGYPGLQEHMEIDAQSFAEWGVDMVKIDACFTDARHIGIGYMQMGTYLNKTNRPMLFSCSWPYYQLLLPAEPMYGIIAQHCNTWRNYHDIQDSWKSILNIIDFFGDNQAVLIRHTGPGRWSDPDMLMIGNFGLRPGQARAQMGIWSMIPAPLLMSNDLREIEPIFKDILQNPKVIAINQDPLGIPGKRIYKKNDLEVWKRRISPSYGSRTSFALLFLNRARDDATVEVDFLELGLRNEKGYLVFQVFKERSYGVIFPNKSFSISVPEMDIVMLNCRLYDGLYRRNRVLI